ncbi:MAG: glycosyltransferase [Acidobacteria bacterium]|nr:glycosyltransferase [Acidobacteriota bacterium]MBV9474817.1 glycosyltransferase [Acidobacteriota bacterium]
MHVLLLPSWFDTVDKPWRGTFFRDQATALRRRGVDAGIAFVERRSLGHLRPRALHKSHFQVTFEHGEVPIARMRGWSVVAQTVPGGLLWCSLMRRLVHRYIDVYGMPDLIHGHAGLWGGYAALRTASELGIPYVVTEHASRVLVGEREPRRRQLLAETYQHAAAVITVSRALQRSVEPLMNGRRTIVVPNTVDLDFFTMPRKPRTRTPFRFLTVCDLVASKRVDLAIRALATLRQRGVDATLTCAGTGKEAAALEQLARDLGIANAVTFTGALPRDAVRRELHRANALVHPSLFETFGVVLIEALATGLPVLATRCGGPSEIIDPSLGELVDPGSEDQLTAAMLRMTERTFDANALRASVANRFSYDAIGAQLVSLYQRILGDRYAERWELAAG